MREMDACINGHSKGLELTKAAESIQLYVFLF